MVTGFPIEPTEKTRVSGVHRVFPTSLPNFLNEEKPQPHGT